MSDVSKHIVLAGPQNAGKSTLFNLLTTGYARPVNYAGSTVDFNRAPLKKEFNFEADLTDSPGIISLNSHTPEQKLTSDFLYETKPELIIAAVDATQLERHLYPAMQLKEQGFPVLVCITMRDLLEKSSRILDIKKLEELIGLPVIAVDNHQKDSANTVAEAARLCLERQVKKTYEPSLAQEQSVESVSELYSRIDVIKEKVITLKEGVNESRDMDRLFLHPLLGPMLFFSIMLLAFFAIYSLAGYPMEWIENFFAWVSDSTVSALFGKSEQIPWWGSFITDGLIAGTEAFAMFLPQIIILFLCLSILEDSGYLARGAVLVDKPLSMLGLNGRSFLPLLSGFACAIPAMMAARTVKNPLERKLTILIIPLMNCSARLPVYLLLIGFFTESAFTGSLIMTGLYLFSLIIGALAAVIISRLPAFKHRTSTFQLELPSLRVPIFRVILKSTRQRTGHYIKKAAPIIFIISVCLWLMTNFPLHRNEASQKLEVSEVNQSYAASIGHFTEPVMEPMGLDWRGSIVMISGFAAREVFVQSLALAYRDTSLSKASETEEI